MAPRPSSRAYSGRRLSKSTFAGTEFRSLTGQWSANTSGSRPIVVLAFLKGCPCAGRGSPSTPPAVTIGKWRRVPGTRFPVSAVIVGGPRLLGVASKNSTRSLPSSASPCRREAYDGRSIDPLSRPSYIPGANRGRSGSQLEDGSAWEGSMELTRRCLLRWGIMLGGGAALIPTRRWFVVLSLTFALASLAHAAPGDPRLVQGVLEWPTTLTAEPFVVIRHRQRAGHSPCTWVHTIATPSVRGDGP